MSIICDSVRFHNPEITSPAPNKIRKRINFGLWNVTGGMHPGEAENAPIPPHAARF